MCSAFWDIFDETIRKNFPELSIHFEATMAICGILGIPKPWKPFALIYEGPSGPGKSTVPSTILAAGAREVQARLYRSDEFTKASFVSQAAHVKTADLKNVHLLPKIKDKVLITAELGSMFRGKLEEIENRWTTIARVLDGRGLTTDSGVHGQTGYVGEYLFCWIGATTYLPKPAFEAMSNVGNRIFFFDVRPKRPTMQILSELAQRGGSGKNEQACADACEGLLFHYFTEHVGPKCDSPLILPEIGPDAGDFIASAAWSIARLRRNGSIEPEYEYRIVEALSVLARARAAIEGDAEVRPHHIEIIRHIVSSSARVKLRTTMAIVINRGFIDAAELDKGLGCERDTSLKYMGELALTGVVNLTDGKAPSPPTSIKLHANAKNLRWGFRSSTVSGGGREG